MIEEGRLKKGAMGNTGKGAMGLAKERCCEAKKSAPRRRTKGAHGAWKHNAEFNHNKIHLRRRFNSFPLPHKRSMRGGSRGGNGVATWAHLARTVGNIVVWLLVWARRVSLLVFYSALVTIQLL